MKIAALYDIHGNRFALEAVLEELRRERPDTILVGGDIVLGPFPVETLALLERAPCEVRYIRGNTEREVIGAGAGDDRAKPWAARAAWVKAQLTREQLDALAGLPEQVTLDVDDLGPTLFCHGSPRSDDEIVTYLTSDERLRGILRGIVPRTVVLGHTHVQFHRVLDGMRVINAGSVGLAYEDQPGAYWALLGPEVDLRRTDYDRPVAAAAIAASSFPDAEDFVRKYVLEAMSRRAASELFEGMALQRPKA
jgi:predicted phosphodiesterase